jgi:glutamate-5-semialdehyde dehydrogenase
MDDAGPGLLEAVTRMGPQARAAQITLAAAPLARRRAALAAAAAAIGTRSDAILEANAEDLEAAYDLAAGLRDRLRLTPERLQGAAQGLLDLAGLEDPLGIEQARWSRPNGLVIARVSVPIGVIGMIYEARPLVTVEAAGLCLLSGNALVLRSARDALGSCQALIGAVQEGLRAAALPVSSVQLVATGDRRAVDLMLEGLGGSLDLLIPRGGAELVRKTMREARVPVLSHDRGMNHTYVHASADPELARRVVLNAKMRRTSICGATETLLIDRAAAPSLLPPLVEDLVAAGCEVRGDETACALSDRVAPAGPADWDCEHLDAVIGLKVVEGLEAAVAHIGAHGSGHTEAILAADEAVCERFASAVDAAIIMINASTQFADGAEFGFGGEMGIATGRLHARGPVGPRQLTTYKYVVRGTGQTRP